VRYRRTGWDGIFDLQEESRGLSQLLPTGVAVEKVRDRNVFSAAMIAAAECFLLTSAKRRLPQWGLSAG
jgi:hypothetical protein